METIFILFAPHCYLTAAVLILLTNLSCIFACSERDITFLFLLSGGCTSACPWLSVGIVKTWAMVKSEHCEESSTVIKVLY
jgi:hypothetical protein